MTYTVDDVIHVKAKIRRDALRAARVCINSGPTSRVAHGVVHGGGRCFRCHEIKNGRMQDQKTRGIV